MVTHDETALLLIARPGGGKETTFKGLKERGIKVTELPFRAKLDREVHGKTALGQRINHFRKGGLLVPNEIILPLVDEAFEDVKGSHLLVLDGFPRNVDQIDFAIERVRHFGYKRVIALYIDTPPYTCMRRLAGRKRDDQDNDPENIAIRLEEFDLQTAPVITHLRKNAEKLGVEFFIIDGENLRSNMDAYVRMLNIGWMSGVK